ncbi:MAG: hypothetical protein HOY79_27110 [Streptomyces sp.]|nr:hypothetical protein [Streptomyces sp.]
MEQRTDHLAQPVTAAGTDPAYIPGLTPSPRPPAAPAAAPKDADEPGADAEAEPAASSGSARPAGSESVQKTIPETLADYESGGEEDEAESAPEPDDGPVFEASDRRSTIVADHVGITLTLDGQAAEFRWAEIGAVEIDTSRFGKRLGLTVHTVRHRSYQGDVEASSRGELKRWTAELDAVLDARFDEGEPEEPEKDAPAVEEDAGRAEAEAAEEAAESAEAAESEEAAEPAGAEERTGAEEHAEAGAEE